MRDSWPGEYSLKAIYKFTKAAGGCFIAVRIVMFEDGILIS